MKIKPYKQSKGYCGPACLKMIMGYYSINKSEKTWAKLTKTSRVKGCKEKNIVTLAKKLGFNSYMKQRSSIKEIRSLIKKGYQVIVNWFSPEEAGHYSVVVKFDRKNIYLADPHFGKTVKQDLSWFKERWFDVFDDKLILRGIIVIAKKK